MLGCVSSKGEGFGSRSLCRVTVFMEVVWLVGLVSRRFMVVPYRVVSRIPSCLFGFVLVGPDVPALVTITYFLLVMVWSCSRAWIFFFSVPRGGLWFEELVSGHCLHGGRVASWFGQPPVHGGPLSSRVSDSFVLVWVGEADGLVVSWSWRWFWS
ncbi:hypothetical protein F2Q68_00041126 [Brassica cretica]|uniref:Transmembrane protein n=1 Tax=Brassica cretica TaxID=69181 RepID=A0A8S9MT99_BRACR|nr:hypothetical protein F2Q68_00041126 [Brassica cretica]